MTQEEKAKVYDKFVEELKSKFKDFQVIIYSKNDLEKFFLELREESEDERIRKELINYLITDEDNGVPKVGQIPIDNVITWLEKQKTDKEINLIEILKHYPRETELYSPLYGKLWLAEVDEKAEIITCYKHPLEKGCTRAILEQEDTVSFYSNGTTGLPDFTVSKDCMLFLYDIEKQSKQKPIDYNEELKKCRENPLYFFDKYVKLKLKEQKTDWDEEDGIMDLTFNILTPH